MTTVQDWTEGARLRTLPAAIAPVLLGIGAAHFLGAFSLTRSALALSVALLLQIGVNFANDYSDGVRGTDAHRTGPPRLTGGGKVAAKTVLSAALVCFGLAGLLGLILLWISHTWWLLIPGVLAVLAAWFYTGGAHPYGYMGVGLSELFVFVFFGLMATIATTWVQAYEAPWWLWAGAAGTGLQSVGLLFVNNIRDIPTDKKAGKQTLPVRLGQSSSRITFALLVVLGTLLVASPVLGTKLWIAHLFIFAAPTLIVIRPVLKGAKGQALLSSLRHTGLLTLFTALFTMIGLITL